MGSADGPFRPVRLVNRLDPLRPPVAVTVAVPNASRRQNGSWWTSSAMMAVLVLLGVGLRTTAYLGDRCLWIDESRLALNLVTRTPAELLQPLAYDQGAPVGFLMIVKACVDGLGSSERSLRLFPFLMSLAGLVGFVWVAVRLLPRPAAVLAVGLFAASPHLIGYAAECKQYSSDATLAIGLLGLSLPLLDGRGNRKRWVALAAAGAVAVWFSHPATFVLGGIGTALFARAAFAGDRERFRTVAAVVGCWLVSFAGVYFVNLRQLGANHYLLDFWAGHFLPRPRSLGDLLWLPDHFFGFLKSPGGLAGSEVQAAGLSGLLVLAGWAALGRERWPVALASAGAIALLLFASGLHKYPVNGRLLLFLVPFALLAAARGAEAIGSALRPKLPFAAALVVGLPILSVGVQAYQQLRSPDHTEQITPVIAGMREQYQPGDRIYLYYGAVPAFTFYTRANPFPAAVVVEGAMSRQDRTGYRDQLAAFRGHSRVWLVFSHPYQDEDTVVKAYAEGLGRCESTIRAPGSVAYLFDFSHAASEQ